MKSSQEELEHLLTEEAVLDRILSGASAPEIRQAVADRREIVRARMDVLVAEAAAILRSAA